MGGNALVWVTFIVIQLVHVYINLIDYCWYTVLWDHIRDATWYLIWSNTGHLTFIWLYGFGGQNEGVVWRVVEKEFRERGYNLFRSFAWTFYAWSIPFVSKYNMSNKRKTAPSVKYGETNYVLVQFLEDNITSIVTENQVIKEDTGLVSLMVFATALFALPWGTRSLVLKQMPRRKGQWVHLNWPIQVQMDTIGTC